ncbi:hypothetical protein TSAR_007911 [Trichomalopsis sarcophagae]|uniref:Uncharacterized protein n=1 Tax=Trichomalopsis sarcophagae TaxID=543379 RepID=A0A232FLX3_9HYME|nr:hypothetical protein TSAR_007911 [Trichomalopsis sarcophagae]
MDSKPVSILSTTAGVHHTAPVDRYDKSEKLNKQLDFPRAFCAYNKNMGGLDIHDQHCNKVLPIFRSKKWTWVIFMRYIQMSITNATVLYNTATANKGRQIGTKDIIAIAKTYLRNDVSKIHEVEYATTQKYCSRQNCKVRTKKWCKTCNLFFCKTCFDVAHRQGKKGPFSSCNMNGKSSFSRSRRKNLYVQINHETVLALVDSGAVSSFITPETAMIGQNNGWRHGKDDRYTGRQLNHRADRLCGSAWSSNIVLAKKKDGKRRFCINFQGINKISIKDAHPLPQVRATLNKLREAKYLTTIDLKNGYWQIPLSEESKKKKFMNIIIAPWHKSAILEKSG